MDLILLGDYLMKSVLECAAGCVVLIIVLILIRLSVSVSVSEVFVGGGILLGYLGIECLVIVGNKKCQSKSHQKINSPEKTKSTENVIR